MKAAVYLGKEQVEVRNIENPVCGDHDVVIKNICSSVCGTDAAVYREGPATGHKVIAGGEFGHETVSRVVQVGKDVTEFKVGDRVYPYPLYAKNDRSRAGTLGAFSEFILCPNAKLNHSLYFVDDSITDREACLIEPFTVGGRAAIQANPKASEKAVVFGCGTIGIAAAIMLKHRGLERVMICDRSQFRLDIAKKLGFETCNTDTEDFTEHATAYYGNGNGLKGNVPDIDIWIDAAGASSIMDYFMENGTIGSRFVIVAVNDASRSMNLLSLTYASQSIIGSGGYRPEDVIEVMDIMKSRRWDIEEIITNSYPLVEINEALQKASDSEHAFNVMIQF